MHEINLKQLYPRVKAALRKVFTGAYLMEPPSPIQALGVNPFPSRFIIRTVPRGRLRAPTVGRANHNDEMILLLYLIKQQEIRC